MASFPLILLRWLKHEEGRVLRYPAILEYLRAFCFKQKFKVSFIHTEIIILGRFNLYSIKIFSFKMASYYQFNDFVKVEILTQEGGDQFNTALVLPSAANPILPRNPAVAG